MTLALQLIPYSIAGGMGVYLGIGAWRCPTIVVAPLFLIASLWEFFLD